MGSPSGYGLVLIYYPLEIVYRTKGGGGGEEEEEEGGNKLIIKDRDIERRRRWRWLLQQG